jgi:hypothetical protein
MSKRERIEYSIENELEALSLRPEKMKKYELQIELKKEIKKKQLEKIKREREDEILNELFFEKKRRMETKEYLSNIELKQKRLRELYSSMYM